MDAPARPHFLRAGAALFAAAAVAMLLAAPALAGAGDEDAAARVRALTDDGWKEARVRHGVHVLSRTTPGSPVREIRAVAVTPASPEALMAVVAAYDDYPDFMPYVVESEVLASGGGVTRVFQHLDFGPPISDRAYTIRLVDFRSPHDGSRGVAWTLETAPAYQRETKAVRPVVNDGSWTFTPLADGATRIDYLVRSDPGGWVPNWASAMAMRRSVPEVVGAVTRRALDGRP